MYKYEDYKDAVEFEDYYDLMPVIIEKLNKNFADERYITFVLFKISQLLVGEIYKVMLVGDEICKVTRMT